MRVGLMPRQAGRGVAENHDSSVHLDERRAWVAYPWGARFDRVGKRSIRDDDRRVLERFWRVNTDTLNS